MIEVGPPLFATCRRWNEDLVGESHEATQPHKLTQPTFYTSLQQTNSKAPLSPMNKQRSNNMNPEKKIKRGGGLELSWWCL